MDARHYLPKLTAHRLNPTSNKIYNYIKVKLPSKGSEEHLMPYLLIILKILTLLLFQTIVSETALAKDRVFVLAGQSNMRGLGAVSQLPHWQRRTPHNVSFYDKGSRGPVPLVRGGRFGPEVSFAHKLARSFPHDRIIIIKVAAGGTPITQWMPGTRNYRAIVQHVRHTVNREFGYDFPIDAILWMHGESDANASNRANRYAAHLKRFIHSLRRDLRSPHSLFLIGQINPLISRFPQVRVVQTKQAQVNRQVHGTQLVSTQGLSKMYDQLHYDSNGLLRLGERFAAAYFRSRPASRSRHFARR